MNSSTLSVIGVVDSDQSTGNHEKIVNILSPCWLVPNLRTVKVAVFFYLLTCWRNLT